MLISGIIISIVMVILMFICSIIISMVMMVSVLVIRVLSVLVLVWVICLVLKFRWLIIIGVDLVLKCDDGRCRYFFSICLCRLCIML